MHQNAKLQHSRLQQIGFIEFVPERQPDQPLRVVWRTAWRKMDQRFVWGRTRGTRRPRRRPSPPVPPSGRFESRGPSRRARGPTTLSTRWSRCALRREFLQGLLTVHQFKWLLILLKLPFLIAIVPRLTEWYHLFTRVSLILTKMFSRLCFSRNKPEKEARKTNLMR